MAIFLTLTSPRDSLGKLALVPSVLGKFIAFCVIFNIFVNGEFEYVDLVARAPQSVELTLRGRAP